MVIILCSRNLNVTFTEYCDKRSYFYKLLYYDLVFQGILVFSPWGPGGFSHLAKDQPIPSSDAQPFFWTPFPSPHTEICP